MSVASSVGRGYFSPNLRLQLYLALNLCVLVAVGMGVAISAPANPRILHVLLLTALCASPILKLERLNGGYFVLAVYSAVFFDYFALNDLVAILIGQSSPVDEGLLSRAEFAILLAGAATVGGYHLAARWPGVPNASTQPQDWPFIALLAVGLLFWISGTLGLGYWQTFIITDRTNASLIKNLNDLGPWLTTVFMVGQLVQPLGVLILAYAYATYRRTSLFALIMLVVLMQVVLGFIADFKGEAMQAGILVILVKLYVDGRPPWKWLLAGVLFLVFAFPVFQAYRLQVRGEHGVTSVQALENLLETLESALQASEKASAGFGGAAYKTQSFLERGSLKSSVEVIIAGTGTIQPFQMGATFAAIPAAFIPKIVWPNKPSIAVGQVFNREFHLAEPDTYISPTHVGELYWNFGWPGLILGSALIGLILGWVGLRCGAFPHATLTRLMMVVVTIYAFAIGSEGSISVAVVPWIRSTAAIGILHWMFARRAPVARFQSAGPSPDAAASRSSVAPPPFPQLLR
jgi:hypothetical protein